MHTARVLGFFSRRPNWNPLTPSPHPQSSVSPPLVPGGDTLACGRGGGGPNSDEGTHCGTLGMTLNGVQPLCIVDNTVRVRTTGRQLSLPPSSGKNHLNEEITPLLPTGIGERFSQTISNLGHAALLRRCPHINESAELTGGPLVNSLL